MITCLPININYNKSIDLLYFIKIDFLTNNYKNQVGMILILVQDFSPQGRNSISYVQALGG